MIDLLLPIFITIYVYKQAKENGRNAILWSAINLVVIFGVQIFLGLAIRVGEAIGIEFLGWDENLFDSYFIGFDLFFFIISLICSYFFVVRTVTLIPDEHCTPAPPPPPKFN